MRRFSQRHNFTTLAEINITPLLDLAFVLLIIFIITTPLLDRSVDIIVPSSQAAQNAVDPASVQTLSINRHEVLALNGEQLPIEQVESRLRDLKNEKPGLAVVIRSHRELPVQKLIDVIDVLQRVEIMKVGIVTNPDTE